jgi:arylsulfatase A-like enzyme
MALRGGEVNTHNKPLRSGKTSGYEGGLRVPMIVSWAGMTKKETVCSQNVIIEDFFPTILEAANIKNYKTIQKVDGLNLVPLFKGKKMDKNRILTWHYPHIHDTKVRDVQPFSAIRKGKWKLMYFQKDQHFELYDTDNDIGETQNLASKNPKMVKKLGLLLSEKLRKSNSLMIIDMKTNKSVPFPDAQLN